MTLDDAFNQLSRSATARQLPVADTPATRSPSGHRQLEVSHRGASLRLRCSLGDGVICLEITHGPEDAPASSWLDLYKARCELDTVRTSDEPDVSFGDAVEFGLELIYPPASDEENP